MYFYHEKFLASNDANGSAVTKNMTSNNGRIQSAIKNEIGEVETSPIKSNGKYSVFQYPSFFAQTTGQN